MSQENSLPEPLRTKLRVLEHLPREGDESLIILKGHLLVEELLFSLVRSAARCPAVLENGKLSFFDLATVAKALFFEERETHDWEAIFALNGLRNAYAHDLEPPKREKLLRRFGTAMAHGNRDGGDETVARPGYSIVTGVVILCGWLAGLRNRDHGESAT